MPGLSRYYHLPARSSAAITMCSEACGRMQAGLVGKMAIFSRLQKKDPVSLPEDTTSSSLLPDGHLHVVSSAIVSAFLSSPVRRAHILERFPIRSTRRA